MSAAAPPPHGPPGAGAAGGAGGPDGGAAADLALLIAAAEAAAPLALAAFRPGRETGAERRLKSDRSLVTAADLAVNGALREILRAARPQYGWLSEEDADDPARLSAERAFIIDPIDGTRSFAEGRPEFALSLAVATAGSATAAVVMAPALEQLYAAALGGGARRDGAALGPPPPGRGLEAAEALIVQGDLRGEHWRGGRAPAFGRTRYLHPLALRLCRAAEGAADAMVVLKRTHEWDVAAGALIAAEAGLVVTDKTGAPLRLNQPEPRVVGVLAAAEPLHGEIRARLR